MGVMRMKHCQICGKAYEPDPRTRRIQKSCSRPTCRKQRKSQADQRWRSKNPGYNATRQGKLRQWAARYPNYWQDWRARHPGYVERNRERTRERRKASRLVFAKQDAIRRDPVGYLEGLCADPLFAKQDAIKRFVDGILSYLLAREVFAKQNAIVPATGSMASYGP